MATLPIGSVLPVVLSPLAQRVAIAILLGRGLDGTTAWSPTIAELAAECGSTTALTVLAIKELGAVSIVIDNVGTPSPLFVQIPIGIPLPTTPITLPAISQTARTAFSSAPSGGGVGPNGALITTFLAALQNRSA